MCNCADHDVKLSSFRPVQRPPSMVINHLFHHSNESDSLTVRERMGSLETRNPLNSFLQLNSGSNVRDLGVAIIIIIFHQ